MRFKMLVVVAAVGLATGCGGSSSNGYTMSPGGTGGPGANAVFMQSSAFNPTTLTVTAGATVTWTNQDAVTHTVTYSSGPGTTFSGSVAPGATFQHTFAVVGTYEYYCQIHGAPGSGMHATVVAQ
jgi:plastocyanin